MLMSLLDIQTLIGNQSPIVTFHRSSNCQCIINVTILALFLRVGIQSLCCLVLLSLVLMWWQWAVVIVNLLEKFLCYLALTSMASETTAFSFKVPTWLSAGCYGGKAAEGLRVTFSAKVCNRNNSAIKLQSCLVHSFMPSMLIYLCNQC